MNKRFNYKLAVWGILFFCQVTVAAANDVNFFPSNHPLIQYTGRIDFSNPVRPRFWQPGVYISIKFTGTYCDFIVQDEMLWGSNHNYLTIILDGKITRMQTRTRRDTIVAGKQLLAGKHTLVICKSTEANIGWMELIGFNCENLVSPDTKPLRKIEFIGNSITCGTGSDTTTVPCGKGKWHDQHNAYLSYGPLTARELNAQYHLSSVSGIGLMHSCCNMDILMPRVFDKVSMRDDTIPWDFHKYQPDMLTICLGQNDGIQDQLSFRNNYIRFLRQLRTYYPRSVFLLLSSPMADIALRDFMKSVLPAIADKMRNEGDKNVFTYIFQEQYSGGCDGHPSLSEHEVIARQLVAQVKKIMKW